MPRRPSLGDALMVAGALGVLFGVEMTWGPWAVVALVGLLLVIVGWIRG